MTSTPDSAVVSGCDFDCAAATTRVQSPVLSANIKMLNGESLGSEAASGCTFDANALWLEITNAANGLADANCMLFTIPTLERPNLFVRAEDWTGVDSNGDGIPNCRHGIRVDDSIAGLCQ
jgi:hypothetical protein